MTASKSHTLKAKLDDLAKDTGHTFKLMAQRLNMSEDTINSWRRSDRRGSSRRSRPSFEACIALGFFESQETGRDAETACREWLQLAERTYDEKDLRSSLEERAKEPMREQLSREFLDEIEPLFTKRGLLREDLHPLAIAKLSQTYSRLRLEKWLAESPGGTASFFWDGLQPGLRALTEQALDKHAAHILSPQPGATQALWVNPAQTNLFGFIILPTDHGDKADVEEMARGFHAAYSAIIRRLAVWRPSIENLEERFRFYVTSKFPLDSLGRWIYVGSKTTSVRGTIIAEADENLVYTARHVGLGDPKPGEDDDVAAWTEPAIEMSRPQVERFLFAHDIKLERGQIIPRESNDFEKGWLRLLPQKSQSKSST